MLYRFANGCCVPLHPSRCGSTPSSAWANSARRGFYLLIDHANERQQKTSCRSQEVLVEHRRFELLTPTLPVLCATSCANAPNNVYIITLQMICKGVKSSFFKFLQKNRISAKAVLSRWTSRLLFSYVEERKVLPQPLFAQKKRPKSLILQNCGCPKMPLCPIFSPAMYSRPVPCGALAAVPWRDNSGA